MKKTFRYIGQTFKQRKDGLATIQFIAPAEDLEDWGGIPQKTTRFMKGYQRAEDESRVIAISEFFEQEGNISPTAVVVAFHPKRIQLKPLSIHYDQLDQTNLTLIGEPTLIEIDYDDFADLSVPELASKAYETLAGSVILEAIGSVQSEKEPDEDDPQNQEIELSDDEELIAESELSVYESHLTDFLQFLRSPEQLEVAQKEDEKKLRTMLANILKPATIVDGQHRAKGAADIEERIPFTVVGLLEADWSEQAFQFIIINQKAKPIASEFLTSIISASLSPQDINKLRERLEQSKVDLANTTIINLVHYDESSPFKGRVDFKVQGSTGSLGYAGMLALAKRFQGLKTHQSDMYKFRPFFETVFAEVCPGRDYAEKTEEWSKNEWFIYFVAFWETVRNKYSELWEPGNNLYKIVTFQEIQNLFLSWLFSRSEAIKGADDLKEKAEIFLKDIKPDFFIKFWQLKSLQSESGRKYLRRALEKARMDSRYKYDDDLFKGVK